MRVHNSRDIRHADDRIVIASKVQDLQNLLRCMNESCKKCELEINKKKTKIMRVSVDGEDSDVCVQLECFSLEHFIFFKNLGSVTMG